MAHVADHLSLAELEQRYRSCADVTATRHFQTIWLLAKGHDIAEVSATMSFAPRWVERLLARYNAKGAEALGDLRRHNGRAPSILKADLLEALKLRLGEPPPDGGRWTARKVAAWMAGELGLAAVAPQRGWDALKAIDWTVQRPRPRHPQAATPDSRESFKKAEGGCCRGSRPAPGPRGRGVRHRRAPHRPQANPAPGLGAPRRAPHRARAPPLQVALRDGFRSAKPR